MSKIRMQAGEPNSATLPGYQQHNSYMPKLRLGDAPLSTVGSELQINQFKFMHTSDTSFGEYRDYGSPMTYRAVSPSIRRNRGSLIMSDSLPLEVTTEMPSQQSESKILVKTTRQIEDSYEGEIPDTPFGDLPPNYNEAVERNKMER